MTTQITNTTPTEASVTKTIALPQRPQGTVADYVSEIEAAGGFLSATKKNLFIGCRDEDSEYFWDNRLAIASRYSHIDNLTEQTRLCVLARQSA